MVVKTTGSKPAATAGASGRGAKAAQRGHTTCAESSGSSEEVPVAPAHQAGGKWQLQPALVTVGEVDKRNPVFHIHRLTGLG